MEPIGIRTIQSILMNATQTSLSHFHTAGMLEEHGTLVKPSVADAMDSYYTNKNTSMIFDVQAEDVSKIRGRLAHAKLDDFVYMVRSSFTVLPERENIWYEALGRPMSRGNVLRLYVDFEKTTASWHHAERSRLRFFRRGLRMGDVSGLHGNDRRQFHRQLCSTVAFTIEDQGLWNAGDRLMRTHERK